MGPPVGSVLGAVVPLTLLLGRNDEYAFALDEFRAYPNGFTCNVVTLRSPLVHATSARCIPRCRCTR